VASGFVSALKAEIPNPKAPNPKQIQMTKKAKPKPSIPLSWSVAVWILVFGFVWDLGI